MSRQQKFWRQTVELGKDLLIVALACLAVWLAGRAQLLRPLLHEEGPPTGPVQPQEEIRADAARPVRISANRLTGSMVGSGDVLRCGVQYDQETVDALFQQVASLLVEALSSAGTPEVITREQWEQALTTAPGVCLDFQGTIPLEVLAGWLAVGHNRMDVTVRRLALTVWRGSVALFFRDETSGVYYRCLSEVANQLHLSEALESLADNGAFYAFESELYANLDPDTLLTGQTPEPKTYTAFNPAAGGQKALEKLMEDLGLPVSGSSFYSVGDERVARIGDDTLRLSNRGRVEYRAGEDGGRFPDQNRPADDSLFEITDVCRRLAAASVGERAGEARLYLMSVEPTAKGWQIDFGFCLNGIQVQLSSGSAASFQVENGCITQFVLQLRGYAESGGTSPVAPVRQTAAAMDSMGLSGRELLLVYRDTASESLQAAWAAAPSN